MEVKKLTIEYKHGLDKDTEIKIFFDLNKKENTSNHKDSKLMRKRESKVRELCTG